MSGDEIDASPWTSEHRFTYSANQAPNPPINLQPANGILIGNQWLLLSWQDGGDPDNGPSATRNYYVDIWQVGGTWKANSGWRFETNWQVTLPGAGVYAWRVVAGDGLAASAPSAEYRFTADAPTAPDGLRQVARTANSITLAWNDKATNEAGYRVYRWNGNTAKWDQVVQLGPNATSYTDTGLYYPLGYAYTVAAYNSYGQRSPNEISAFIAVAQNDLDWDGKSDLLWRHQGSGLNLLYLMNGANINRAASINHVRDLKWQAVGTGDFNADGKSDILWRHTGTGQNLIYFMNKEQIVAVGSINTVADQAWKIAGVADFNNDGRADILWRHAQTGANRVYLMNGARIEQNLAINVVSDLGWQVAALDDFNLDGYPDILWRHANNGFNHIYFMNGGQIIGSAGVNAVRDLDWKVVGSGDYNGDGRADILWRHMSRGENFVYLMNGAQMVGTFALPKLSDLNWQVVGSGDYNGDGRSDVVWRHRQTGANRMFLVHSPTSLSNMPINTVADMNWRVVGRGSNTFASWIVGNRLIETESSLLPFLTEAELAELEPAQATMEMSAADPSAMETSEAMTVPPMEMTDADGLLGPNGEIPSAPPEGIAVLPMPSDENMLASTPPLPAAHTYRIYVPLSQR